MNNKVYRNKTLEIKPIKSSREEFKEYCCTDRTRISTGYLNLDILLGGGLMEELYVLGAQTSIGKSAFLMSIAQNIAKSGINVLYFSLEMSNKEHIARGASSISYESKLKGESTIAYTAQDILNWQYNQDTGNFGKLKYSCYEPFLEEYFKRYGDNLYIIENKVNGLSADRIFDIALEFACEHQDGKFVVIIDYLQIVYDSKNFDRKSRTDDMMSMFKRISLQLGIPVFCISSIGRDSYGKRVSNDSFKESGNIEYGGGINLGFNWCGVTVKPNNGDEELLRQCKREGCRLIELDILKTRNGECGTRARFKYNPAYNYFEEIRD